jgi:L-fuculose-phosphate aldolase
MEQAFRADIVQVCRRLHQRGLLAGAEGNVSVRLNDDILITPSGADKANVREGDVVVTGITAIAGPAYTMHDAVSSSRLSRDSSGRPSSEIEMHRACYLARPDVCAVVHAHPPVATGMATAGYGLPPNVVPELPVVVGPVALVPYARPGTPALSAAMQPMLAHHEVFLLANHGVTAVGRTLGEALQRLESTEQAARIAFVARLMGGAQALPDSEVAALVALHPRYARHLNEEGIE